MFAKFRSAAFVAVSGVGLAGSSAFAQEPANEAADPAAPEYFQLELAPEAVAPTLTKPYITILAGQDGAAVGEAVAEEESEAEELPGLWIGVQLATEIPPALAHHLKDAKGAVVETVYPDSPAAESGIETYDLIVRVGESEVDSPAKLLEAMKEVEAKPVDVVVMRGGEKKIISVTPRERATAQPNATATADATDLLFYNLNVPHIRVLPALTGPDAGAMHHRLVTSFVPEAKLPEDVEFMKIQIERDGEKVVHRVEVMTVDGKVFKAANEEEWKALPPEIRAILPFPQNTAAFALRTDGAPGAPVVQKQIIVRTVPAAVPPPKGAAIAPAPAAPSHAWVDLVPHQRLGGDVTYRVHPPGEDMNVLKKELSELRASVERIEKLLKEKE